MDQVRKALAWLKRYHFWVLSVLVAVIALVCWKMAAAKLSKELATNMQTIKSAFSEQEKFRSEPFHPNEDVNEKQLKQIELQSKNVESIWKMLYDRQSKGVLTWPEQLGASFLDFVAKAKFGEEIPKRLRDNYRDYIDRHFESLPKQIGAQVLEASAAGGLGGEGYSRGGGRGSFRGEGPMYRGGEDGGVPGAANSQEDDYICEWLDQGLVRQELDFPTTPSSIRIWVTQENLWVYHTLLDIIAKTNKAKGSDRMSNAAVRTIVSMEVGRPAAMASLAQGRVEILQAPSAGGVAEGGEMVGEGGGREAAPMSDGGGMGERGGYSEGGAMSGVDEKTALLTGRYVDATGKPQGAAAGVEGGDAAAATPTAELPTGAFKLLPVRMVLKMDQRWLTQLISECASQPLPVEVTEVRINPADGGGSGMGGEGFRGGGGEGYRGMDGSGGGVAGSSYQPQLNTSGAAGDAKTFLQHPELATVVIQGTITIYNEPDPSVLKVGSGEQVAATTP